MDKIYPDWIRECWIDNGFDPAGTECLVKLSPSSGCWAITVTLPNGSEVRNYISPPYSLTWIHRSKSEAA